MHKPHPQIPLKNLHSNTAVCSVWDKGYRYGFNGKEIDKGSEGMGGGGSTYDYGFRIYNPSLGKFLSVDPLTASYPWYTPYQFAGNMPIWAIDLDGLEEYIVIVKPDKLYPALSVITIYRISESDRTETSINGINKKNYIQYRFYDENDNLIQTTNQNEFSKDEINSMNTEIDAYKDNDPTRTNVKVKRRDALDYHRLNGDGSINTIDKMESSGYKVGNNYLFSNYKLFKINVSIFFNTDKTTFDKVGLVDYAFSKKEIKKIKSIIENYCGTDNNPKYKGFLKKYKLNIIGGFDIRKSNYKKGCGNICLSSDRAKSVEKELKKEGVENDTNAYGKDKNNADEAKSEDRNVSIILEKK